MSAFDDLMCDAYQLACETRREIKRMRRLKAEAAERGADPKDLRRVESIAFHQGIRMARLAEIFAKVDRLPGVDRTMIAERILLWEFEEE